MSRVGGNAVRAMTVAIAMVAGPTPAIAQESIKEVLSFLLINRSIPTDDFVRDDEAAARTRDAISDFLVTELATLPISSSAGGFTYRLNPALGTMMRSSDNFGPFFAERSLTLGDRRASFGLSYQTSTFDTVDGRSLRDGTLVATASVFGAEPTPFDVETLSLRIKTDTMTIVGNYGVGDRFDFSGAVPMVRLTLSGQRVDTYRGQRLVQATASAVTSGIGDVVVRGKYNVVRTRRSGLAVGAEARLPTGNEENLLGAGEAAFKPRAIGSFENDRIGLHGNIAYVMGPARELDYDAAVTIVAAPRLTFVTELAGRRLASFGRLEQTVEAHPRLANVSTIRLTSVDDATTRLLAIAGVKWNVGGTWLLSSHVRRPLTTAGLNPAWVLTLTLDYSFSR